MSGPPSQRSLVCEEVFDERSQPSDEEVREFALRIGIDPNAESHLLPLAREGLLKPLPKNWKPVYDPATKRYYYFNFKTNQTSWEHPLDNKFRDLVKKNRSESISSAGEEDSKTSIKEELKSFEEAGASIGFEADTTASTKDNLMDYPSSGVPALKSLLSPLRARKKGDSENFSLRKETGKLGRSDLKPVFTPKPLFSQSLVDSTQTSDFSRNKPSKRDWGELSYPDGDSEGFQEIHSHVSEIESKSLAPLDYNLAHLDQSLDPSSPSVIGRFTVDRVKKIDIDSQTKRLDYDGSILSHKPSDRTLKSGYDIQPEFTLSGGGSVFLKSNKKKNETMGSQSDVERSGGLKLDSLQDMDFSLKPIESNFQESSFRNQKLSVQPQISSPSTSTRSILRTPQLEKRLWDVDPQHMSVSEKALWRQQELEEEKKSVRFNLDKELNISFHLSDSSDSDGAVELEHNDSEDDDEPDWNFKSCEDLTSDFKAPPKELSNSHPSLKTEKHVSPLEEWAKETWFSKQTTLEDKTREDSRAIYSFLDIVSPDESGVHAESKSQTSKESHKKYGDEEAQLDILQSDTEVNILQAHSNREGFEAAASSSRDILAEMEVMRRQELLIGEDMDLPVAEAVIVNADLGKATSPVLQEQPVGIVVALPTPKQLIGLSIEDTATLDEGPPHSSKEVWVRERERAFLDWNVKKDDEMHRPPLSRQQSQQQLELMKGKGEVKGLSKAGDRDRALRDWNVTAVASESVSGKSAASAPEAGHQSSTLESNTLQKLSPLGQSEVAGENKDRKSIDKSVSESEETAAAQKTFETKLVDAVEILKLDYEKRLKEKQQEYISKFEKEHQDIIWMFQEKLQKRIEEESRNLEVKCKEMVSQMERDAEVKMKQLREQFEHKQVCASQKILEQHQQALAAQEVENQATMLHVREQLSAEIKILREQFHREEEQIRREHQDRIVNLREDKDGKRNKEITDHLRIMEKLRCEKRLVEDKYKVLKEKYIKLKGEMKLNLEKREQKQKENYQVDDKGKSKTNGAEQEASASPLQQQSDRSSETDSRPKTVSAESSGTSNSLGFHSIQPQSGQEPLNSILNPPPPAPNNGPSAVTHDSNKVGSDLHAPFLGMVFPHHPPLTKRLLSSKSGADPSQPAWSNSSQYRTEKNGNIPGEDVHQETNEFSPLEALRHQLKTLDELEEQFPASSMTDAYLRYPFPNAGSKELQSAEVEFFRHRIHLERDMIRQAKNSLHAQQSEYRLRMHNFQQRRSTSFATTPSTTLHQMAQEEQELSSMEAQLKHTRTILSEKMIHLRQLENSMNHFTAVPSGRPENYTRKTNNIPKIRHVQKAHVQHNRRWDWKNGGGLAMEDGSDDVSSDSGGSSGFSSTEYTSDGTLVSLLSQSDSARRIKKAPDNSADINTSLHNLNAEISEIWNVLCKQRAAAGLGPPPILSTQASTRIDPASQRCAAQTTSVAAESSMMVRSITKAPIDKNSTLMERTNNLRQWLQKAKITATSSTPGNKNDV